MPIYSCRSYRRRVRKVNIIKISSRKIKGRVSKKIIPIFYKCISRRSLFRKNIRSFRLATSSFTEGMFFSNLASSLIQSSRQGGFQKASRLTLISSWSLSNKVYRHSRLYRFSNFYNGAFNRMILFSSDNSININQNLTYFVLSKSDLEKFGLFPKERNSFEEILLSLLFFWENALDSSRINIKLYCHLKFVERSQWFEVQSVLINVLSLASSSTEQFPSPDSFLI